MNIGSLIRKGRKQKNWNQTELAREIGVHQTHISQWENGEKRIYGDDLIKVARLLDIVEEVFPEYKEIHQESDTRRFVRERLYQMEEDVSNQIKLLERRIYERDKEELEKYSILIVSNQANDVTTIKNSIAAEVVSMNIIHEKTEEAARWLKINGDEVSVIIVDVVASFEKDILKLGKISGKKRIPSILLIDSIHAKILKRYTPGTVSVIEKPFTKENISFVLSQINLHWRSKKTKALSIF